MPKILSRLGMVGALLVLAGCSLTTSLASTPDPTDTPATPQPIATAVPAVQVFFTQQGQHPDAVLSEGIRAGTSEVYAALYAIDRPAIVQALIDQQAQCGCVRLLSDATQSGGAAQKAALTRLDAAGVPIKIDSHAGIMHLKLVVVDRQVVFEGSFNATTAASTINDEALFRLVAPDVAVQARDELDAMWNDARRFRTWRPGTSVPTVQPRF